MGEGNRDIEVYFQQGMNYRKLEKLTPEFMTINLVPEIDKVIFNGPATIVKFKDGTKSVVKCAEGDSYSEFAGMAIAICKRLYGSDFKKIFNKHLAPRKYTEKDMRAVLDFVSALHQYGVDTKS